METICDIFFYNDKKSYLKELSALVLKVLGKKFYLYCKLCQNFIACIWPKKIVVASV